MIWEQDRPELIFASSPVIPIISHPMIPTHYQNSVIVHILNNFPHNSLTVIQFPLNFTMTSAESVTGMVHTYDMANKHGEIIRF